MLILTIGLFVAALAQESCYVGLWSNTHCSDDRLALLLDIKNVDFP